MADIKSPQRLDAAETAFFKRQLEKIKSRTYDTKYRNLKAKDFIPVSTEAQSGTEFIIWYSWSSVGVAKIIADYANDFPRVDSHATENQSRVYDIGASYGYNIKEIRRAAMAGTNLNQRNANACRRAHEEKHDRLAWFGDPDRNIQGFIDYPGISEYVVPNGNGGDTEFSTKTPDEMIADLTGLMNAVSVPTKGREEVNQIIMARGPYNVLADTRMTDGNDTSVLQYFKKQRPGVMVDVVDELTGAGAGGSDRMMGYVKDPNNLVQEIPQMFEQFEADKKGMEFEVPCHSEFGGVTVFYPQSVAYGDGI